MGTLMKDQVWVWSETLEKYTGDHIWSLKVKECATGIILPSSKPTALEMIWKS